MQRQSYTSVRIFISSGQVWHMQNHLRNRRSDRKHVFCHKTVQTTWFGNPNLKPKQPSRLTRKLEKNCPLKFKFYRHARAGLRMRTRPRNSTSAGARARGQGACAGLGRARGGGVRVVVEVAQTLYDDDNEDDDIWRLTSQYHDVSSAFYHIQDSMQPTTIKSN